jgi:cob(I)alamin adenosyltransferase
MVKLTQIYTRTGDEGTTGLSDFSRVRKTDPRIEAYADVDEANSALGVALAQAQGELSEIRIEWLSEIQNRLFDVGADLSLPIAKSYNYSPIRVAQEWITDIEKKIDEVNATLSKLDSFVIPGGSLLAANLHLARTIVRRAERMVWLAIETHGIENGGLNPLTAKYLNRLSDLLFVLARAANNDGTTEKLWKPANQ